MARPKHARSESPEIVRKQRKTVSEASEPTGDITSPDLTAVNSIESPLLRLPAELRKKIWAFAFGNNVIKIQIGPPVYQTPQYRVNIVDSLFFSGEIFRPIPTVSKQFYHEAMDARFSTSTFSCYNANYMGYFVECPHNADLKRRMQHLDLKEHLDHVGSPRWFKLDCLEVNVWHDFQDLKGLSLKFSIDHASGAYFGSKADVLNDKVWKKAGVAQLIKAAKQHGLMSSRTSVEFIPAGELASFTKNEGVDVEAVAQQIRGHLLNYRPIRRTGRERKKADYREN